MTKPRLVTRTENSEKKASRRLTPGMKRVDGDKFQDYIINNNIDKMAICEHLGVNRGFINDVIRQNRCRIAFFNLICDEIGVKRDFFDYVEKEEISDSHQSEFEFDLELIHEDLLKLVVYARETRDLMQEMIDMWRND